MEAPVIKKLEADIEKEKASLNAVEKAISKLYEQQGKNVTEPNELIRQRPGIFAKVALGELEAEEQETLSERILWLERAVKDFGPTRAGLIAERAAIESAIKAAECILKLTKGALKNYEAAKKRYPWIYQREQQLPPDKVNSYDQNVYGAKEQLTTWAKVLELEDDLSAFLSQVEMAE